MVFFANAIGENNYFKITTLNQMKTQCFNRAKLIKLQLNSPVEDPSPIIPSFLTQTAFQIDNQENTLDTEFAVDIDKIFQIKIKEDGSRKGSKPIRKKQWGQKWFKNQKRVMYQLNSSSQQLKMARTCTSTKSPELAYKVLTEIYQKIIKEMN